MQPLESGFSFAFPSLDELNKACGQISQTRDVVKGLENGFLAIRPALRTVLDPITQPLSWMLDGTLYLFMTAPWFLIMAVILVAVWFSTRSLSVLLFNAFCLSFFAFVDHFEPAMQTFAVILVCTIISALFGIPIGIAMSKYNRLQKAIIPVLDLLQTLPTFVYLIPLIFLFPIGEVAALRHCDYPLCHCAGDPSDRPWRPAWSTKMWWKLAMPLA